MNQKIYPSKLKAGDEIRVVAPSRSLAIISEELRKIADDRFSDLGLKLSFGGHVEEKDEFLFSNIESRIEDLHDAFRDKNVKAIITVIGGFKGIVIGRFQNVSKTTNELLVKIIKTKKRIRSFTHCCEC